MDKKAIIDKDILGWGDEHLVEIEKKYEKVFQVSGHVELPETISDADLAKYCKKENCVLFTGDQKSYRDYFGAGVQKVQISRYDFWERGQRPIYLIEIVN